MNLRLWRFSSGPDDTLGLLFLDGEFACFTLEDEYREEKVPGETRIPAGTYQLALREAGAMHEKYLQQEPEIHRGMIQALDVPGFEWIYFHKGNVETETDGCILVGDTSQQNVTGRGFVGNSRDAYRRLYPLVAAAILQRDPGVYLDIEDGA